MTDKKLSGEAANFVIKIMSANQNNINNTMNDLYDSAIARAEFAEAETAAIRVKVASLLARGWMPSESAIIEATYPSRVEIDKMLARMKSS